MVKKILASLAPSMRAASKQFVRHRTLCVRAAQEEAERRNAARDDDREHSVGQVQRMEDRVHRDGQQGGRHEHAGHNDADGRVLAAEVEFCGGVASHHRHDGADQCRDARVDQGVQHPAPEVATSPAKQLGIVSGDGIGQLVKRHSKPHAVATGHLGRRLGGRDDGPVNREQEVDQHQYQQHHGEGLHGRGRSHGARQIVLRSLTLLFELALGLFAGAFFNGCGAHYSFTFLSAKVYSTASTPAIRAMTMAMAEAGPSPDGVMVP